MTGPRILAYIAAALLGKVAWSYVTGPTVWTRGDLTGEAVGLLVVAGALWLIARSRRRPPRPTVDELLDEALGRTRVEVPGGTIRCDQPLTPGQVEALRRAWDAARREEDR